MRVPRWVARLLGMPGAVSFRRFDALVRDAATLESHYAGLDDSALRAAATTLALRTGGRLARDTTPRFLAVAREAAARTVGLRAFDEQLVACCALLSGHAVEMDTGEG